jgi:hypothetical protein
MPRSKKVSSLRKKLSNRERDDISDIFTLAHTLDNNIGGDILDLTDSVLVGEISFFQFKKRVMAIIKSA